MIDVIASLFTTWQFLVLVVPCAVAVALTFFEHQYVTRSHVRPPTHVVPYDWETRGL